MNKMQKKATAAALLGTFALAGAGTMAYFTDRAEGQASATAGTLDLVLTAVDGSDVAAKWIDTNDNYHLAQKLSGVKDGLIDPMLPGFKLDMDYKLANEGNKSIDVRESIVITSTKAFKATPEFQLYKEADIKVDPATGSLIPVDGKSPINIITTSADGKTITFRPDTMTLSGKYGSTGQEVEYNGQTPLQDYYTGDYVILFAADADNSWSGESLTIDYLAEAKQHRNTGGKDEWTQIDSAMTTITLTGGSTVDAVIDLE